MKIEENINRFSTDGAETRYPILEKLALIVVMHSIAMLTTQSLQKILHSSSQSGRMPKWAIELSKYAIEYRNQTSVKSQVLADFLIDLPHELVSDNLPSAEKWILHVDGASSQHGSGVGVRIESPTSEILEQSFCLEFPASNNEEEYEALIAGL